MADKVADLPEDQPLFIDIVGRKGTGKTELGWMFWESWEGDRVLVDMTKDVGIDHPDPRTHDIDYPVPPIWPEYLREEDEDRLSLRYVPDTGMDDWREDLDRLFGLCMSHGDVLIWIDDAGEVLKVGKVGPHGRQILQYGRHADINLLLTMPRPQTIEVLALSQADVVYMFHLPNRKDRQRVAENVGWDLADLDAANTELLAVDHSYVRAHVRAHELAIFPPLPRHQVVSKKRYAARHFDDEELPE